MSRSRIANTFCLWLIPLLLPAFLAGCSIVDEEAALRRTLPHLIWCPDSPLKVHVYDWDMGFYIFSYKCAPEVIAQRLEALRQQKANVVTDETSSTVTTSYVDGRVEVTQIVRVIKDQVVVFDAGVEGPAEASNFESFMKDGLDQYFKK